MKVNEWNRLMIAHTVELFFSKFCFNRLSLFTSISHCFMAADAGSKEEEEEKD